MRVVAATHSREQIHAGPSPRVDSVTLNERTVHVLHAPSVQVRNGSSAASAGAPRGPGHSIAATGRPCENADLAS